MMASCRAPCHMFSGRMKALTKRTGASSPQGSSLAMRMLPQGPQNRVPQKPAPMTTSHLKPIQALRKKPMAVKME